jgi:hypothetical protein
MNVIQYLQAATKNTYHQTKDPALSVRAFSL